MLKNTEKRPLCAIAFLEKGTKVTIGSQSDDGFYVYISNEGDGWLQKGLVTLED